MSRVIVELPLDRGFCGRLSAFDESGRLLCGPFAVAARSGDARAQAEGNPRRNPLLRYGDTPTGSYRVTRLARHEARAQDRFGPHGVLVIEATAGDAALAEANGRYRLFVQGGASMPDGSLRSTSGSLRLSNGDLAVLIAALGEEKNVRVDVVAHEGMTQGDAVFVDNSVDDDDPPEIPGAPSALRDLFGEVSRRDALRAGAGGAAGLTALTLAVSFVSLGTPARAEVYTRMAYNEEGQATGNVPGGNTTTTGPGDERTTDGSPGGTPITGDQGQPITGAGVQQGTPDRQPATSQQGVQLNPGAQPMPSQENTGAAPANSAMQQLKNATSGNQTLDQTFDNGQGNSPATPTGNVNVPTPSSAPLIDSQQQQLNTDTQYQADLAAQAQAQQQAADAAQKYQTLENQRKADPSLMNNQTFVTQYYQASDTNTKAASAAATATVKADDRKRVVIGAPIYKTAPPKQ